jgi:hypothetical protein
MDNFVDIGKSFLFWHLPFLSSWKRLNLSPGDLSGLFLGAVEDQSVFFSAVLPADLRKFIFSSRVC